MGETYEFKKYSKTNGYLPKEMETEEYLIRWKRRINLKYDDFEKEIETHKQTENFKDLNDKLVCVKAFSKLEEFLKDSNNMLLSSLSSKSSLLYI